MVSRCLKPVIGEMPDRHSPSPLLGDAGYSLGHHGMMGVRSGGGDALLYFFVVRGGNFSSRTVG